MNSTNYEILDLGLVYFKDIVKDPDKLIDDINKLDARFLNNDHGTSLTTVRSWSAWKNESAGTNEIFCWQKFFPKPDDINKNDFYFEDQFSISKRLYDALDFATDYYTKNIYPFAFKNIKSREYSVHLLRYDVGGYLPAHQDQGVSSRVLSSVMYLNDDYEGGEIKFPNSNISFKPEAGSVIFFPSNFLYVHEVAPITSGSRYSMPHWYHNISVPKMSTGEE